MESKSIWVMSLILAVSLLLAHCNALDHAVRIKKLERELETVTALVAEIDTGCNKLSVYP